jgi:hypothetical protein
MRAGGQTVNTLHPLMKPFGPISQQPSLSVSTRSGFIRRSILSAGVSRAASTTMCFSRAALPRGPILMFCEQITGPTPSAWSFFKICPRSLLLLTRMQPLRGLRRTCMRWSRGSITTPAYYRGMLVQAFNFTLNISPLPPLTHQSPTTFFTQPHESRYSMKAIASNPSLILRR